MTLIQQTITHHELILVWLLEIWIAILVGIVKLMLTKQVSFSNLIELSTYGSTSSSCAGTYLLRLSDSESCRFFT